MEASTHPTSFNLTDYKCIYTEFKDKGYCWGFVQRTSGDWSWCRMDNIGSIVKDKETGEIFSKKNFFTPNLEQIGANFSSTFATDLSEKLSTKTIPFKQQLFLTTDLFERIFPKHPKAELTPFQIKNQEVTESFTKEFAQSPD